MFFTSVTGHIMNMEFDPKYKSWYQYNPDELLLLSASVTRSIDPEKKGIEKNLIDLA